MIRIENVKVVGIEEAIRGMRNPMNSWDKSDSQYVTLPCATWNTYQIGDNDYDLMMKLVKNGSVHAKFRRMITVYMDITAPLYWWKEFDTYKVGTVANSCSTMHKIHDKEFTLEDFSCEHLLSVEPIPTTMISSKAWMEDTIEILNIWRQMYLITKDKKYWWHMIQLLPSSYNQRRTIMLNYEVLANIYKSRKHHKLDEWCEFCYWIELLPYNEIITVSEKGERNA